MIVKFQTMSFHQRRFPFLPLAVRMRGPHSQDQTRPVAPFGLSEITGLFLSFWCGPSELESSEETMDNSFLPSQIFVP